MNIAFILLMLDTAMRGEDLDQAAAEARHLITPSKLIRPQSINIEIDPSVRLTSEMLFLV